VRFVFLTGLTLFRTEDRSSELLRYNGTELSDYMVSYRRTPKQEYLTAVKPSVLYDITTVPIGTVCSILLCGIREYLLLECIHALIQGAHAMCKVCTDQTGTSCQL